MKYLIDYIDIELRHHAMIYKNPVVRIHASGDFFNKDYLNLWLEIINHNEDVKFYTYTKMYNNKVIDLYNSLYDNFNIVKSLINDKYINYGDIEYLEDVTKILDAEGQQYHICGYGHSDNKLSCMGNCTKCLNCSNILFIKH